MNDEHPLVARYRVFSPTSERLAHRAQEVFPGGDTRSSAHYHPYPLVIESAQGPRMVDVDGNEVLDFMNNFTSLIHGHAHADVVTSVQAQVAKGSAYAAPNDDQIALAELIASRIPGIEQLRFTSSGTEGTLMAIRCARAATGRDKIMKMEGGYHGSYELAEVSLVPLPQTRGKVAAPTATPVDDSFPASVLDDTIICPYNAPQQALDLIAQHGADIAAIIVEPMLGSMGMVPATPEFLQALRDGADQHGIVLIFDEVITLRLGLGGAQQQLGVTPDLTCMGKIIGGGLPVGGIGGKRELMQLFNPTQKRPVMHASTFSGNALTMAAGLAAMRNYDANAVAHVNRLGASLREGLDQAFAQAGVRAQMLGYGSLSNVSFSRGPINDARDSIDAMFDAGEMTGLLHLGMLRRGVASASRLMYCTSTGMEAADIDHAVTAMHETLTELRPFIERDYPSLLVA
ncbi:MAG: aspartate aminotransferase family protein [Pseudomonadota bacterium]